MAACALIRPSRSTSRRSLWRRLALAVLAGWSFTAWGQFAAYVQPGRFELTAKPGELLREVFEIGNDDLGATELTVRTSDWTLRRDAGVDFQPDTLAPDSCRPWVRIERHVVKIGGKAKRRFRFEVQVPPGAGDGLCRFALLIEPGSAAANISPLGNIQMPLQARIGIIVYVRVGNAKPQLTLESVAIETMNGRQVPVATLRNSGNAHGRTEGVLVATDAAGRSLDLVTAPLPILPGETRVVPMWPQEQSEGKPVVFTPPLRIKGKIEWEGGQIPVDAIAR